MIDKTQVSIMLKDVERYLSDLSEINVANKSDLEEKEHYYAISMIIFALMNRVIDVGNEIISSSGKMVTPESYKETFDILAHNGVISNTLASKMSNLVKYRNIIAHEYYRLSVDELLKLKEDVTAVDQFSVSIRKYLSK